MLPGSTANNIMYRFWGYAELFTESLERHSLIAQTPNFRYVGTGYFRTVLPFAACLATFVYHILNIVLNRTREKMRRIATKFYVALVEYP